MADWGRLAERLAAASGADAGLDEELAHSLGLPAAAYTGSAESARAWVVAALPGWHVHVGFDASGVFPYAAVSRGDIHVDATGPTVPLALLRTALKLPEHLQRR